MTRVALVALVALAACTEGSPDTDTGEDSDTASTDGCPTGMHAARDPGMLIGAFTYDGLSRSPLFDDGEYLGRPAGCIGDDGRAVDYLFLLLGEPYGRLIMAAPRGDESYDLNGTGTATVAIELFAEEGSPIFQAGEWVNGTWFVSSVGATFDSDLNGQALDDEESHTMTIYLTVEGNR